MAAPPPPGRRAGSSGSAPPPPGPSSSGPAAGPGIMAGEGPTMPHSQLVLFPQAGPAQPVTQPAVPGVAARRGGFWGEC